MKELEGVKPNIRGGMLAQEEDGDEDKVMPNWEILDCTLKRMRNLL